MILVALAAGCGHQEPSPPDDARIDAESADAHAEDALEPDAEAPDAGEPSDAATVDGGATDGAPADAPSTSRMWTTPMMVADHATEPTMTVDRGGNVTAVWTRSLGVPLQETLAVSRFTEAAGWSDAMTLSAGTMRSGDAGIGADANGNVIAVWSENSGTSSPLGPPMQDVWTRRFEPATGWSAAAKLDTSDTLSAVETAVAVAPSGQAIALVGYRDTDTFELWARRYVPGAGWEAPALLTAPSKSASAPALAIDDDGNALVAWEQRDVNDAAEGIWARRFTPSGGWTLAVQLATPASGGVGTPAVAMSAQGAAIAMWKRTDENPGGGAMRSFWARSYSAAGWSEAVRLDEGTGQGHLREGEPRVAFDGAGDAIAVWAERVATVDGVPRYAVQTRRWRDGSWGALSELARSASYYLGLQLAVNASGDAIVAWERQQSERSRSGVRTFTVAAGWAEEHSLRGTADEDVVSVTPQVAITPDGDAVVMWLEHGYEGPSPPRVWFAAYRRARGAGAAR